MKKFTAAAVILFCLPFSAAAFEASEHLNMSVCEVPQGIGISACVSKQIHGCMNAAEGEGESSYVYQKSCGPAAFDQADRLLNSFYQAAIQSAKRVELGFKGSAYSGQEELLRESQRAWLGVRDMTCELAVSFGATMSGSDAYISGCQARLTMQRIEDLKYEIGGYVE
jgi:uncharacterized protein YecT (DUF1311 family)